MSTAAAAPIPERPRLVAPLWHTGLVLTYVLVPQTLWFRLAPLHRFEPQTLNAYHVLLIAIYGGAVGLVCLGVGLEKRPLEDLIGRVWTGWRSVLRDVGLGLGLWLVARYLDRLIYYLAQYTSHRTIPHSIRGIMISIFLAIAAGVAEELIFRGYLQQQFSALCRNSAAGLMIQAILFALFHGYHQAPAQFLQHFCFGLLTGILASWRKSLLPGMIGHAWLDAYWDILRVLKLA